MEEEIWAEEDRPRKIPYVHIVLFVITFFSTLLAGALQKGINPLDEPERLIEGLPFSAALMIILLSHELSHYIASKIHRMQATLPYFIPAPTIIGTFGALIKMKSPITTRNALIDIGASGPIVGFVFSLIASVIGLSASKIISIGDVNGALGLGDSIIFTALSRLVLGVTPEGTDIILHPVAFAGWIGFFVTSLNMLPIGQLDGGHISYALFGNRHRYISIALVVILGVLGIFFWSGWSMWAVLMIVLGLRHPPVVHSEMELGPERKFVGWAAFLIFVLTFTPEPFKINL